MKLSDIDILSEEEKQNLLRSFDRTDIKFPTGETVVSLFERQGMLTPERVAVKLGNTTASYQQLNAESSRIAAMLIDKNVGKEEIVGLFVDRSIEAITGMLGILRAGCAYLPIDTDYPDERIDFTLNDSGARIVLCSQKDKHRVDAKCEVVCFEDSQPAITAIAVRPAPGDLCYIIYTSGSTGNPKGVMITHQNVVRLLFNDAFQFDFGPNDVWTQFHSHCFDFSVWEIYGALLFGGKLVIVPKTTTRDSELFRKLLSDEQVTVLNQTPSAFFNLVESLSVY